MISYGTLFYTAKKADPTLAAVRMRIRWPGGVLHYNTGCTVELSKWSPDTKRCRNNTFHGKHKTPAATINRSLTEWEDRVASVFRHFDNNGEVPTKAMFKEEMDVALGRAKPSDTSFFELWDIFVRTAGERDSWTDGTYTKFASLRKNIMDYDPYLTIGTLTREKMQGLLNWYVSNGYQNKTTEKNFALIRWGLRWLKRNGYYSGDLHETFVLRMKKYDREIIYLTWEELTALAEMELPTERLRQVRDVFCFCCFTGLRYSDAAALTKDDVTDAYIHVVTRKTADSLRIELNDWSKAILDRYKDWHGKGNKALPVCSNQKMNDYLKELGRLAGLDAPVRSVWYVGGERHEEVHPKWELLSTHCGRRTFIVNALALGINAEVVMRWTGHSDYKAMKPYMVIVDDLKAREMRKFNRK